MGSNSRRSIGAGPVNWTILAVAWMAAWAAWLSWFAVLLVRHLRSPLLGALPWRARIGSLVLDGVAVPALLFAGGLSSAWIPLVAAALALALWTFAPPPLASMVLPITLLAVGLNGFV